MRELFVFHGVGVGGGSLGYANVLMEPDDSFFEAAEWSYLADWKGVLREHYQTAKRMLGVTTNPRLWQADELLAEIASEMEAEETFRPVEVGVFFGQPGVEVPDPYFNGKGPDRMGCNYCGGCMVGCRYGAKNSLVKNYLFFAERLGAEIWPEEEALYIRSMEEAQADGSRYEVVHRSSTAWPLRMKNRIRAKNVVLAAGVLGTLRLLFQSREIEGGLPEISPRLGENVRINNEELLGSTSRTGEYDYSKGIAISSIFRPDRKTYVEPARYPDGSSVMMLMATPLIEGSRNFLERILRTLLSIIHHPFDFLRSKMPTWARRSTILLIMQSRDTAIRLRLGRSISTLFRKDLVAVKGGRAKPPAKLKLGHRVARDFGLKSDGIPQESISEGIFIIPTTAHILGGCPMGSDVSNGVVDLECEVFNYPGIYVVDGSILPANLGLNPSLTITALAEYAMSHIQYKKGAGS